MFLIKLFADVILCVSQAVFQAVGASHKKKLLYDGTSFDQSSAGERQEMGSSICYLSNFLPGKGQDLAVQSFAELRSKIPEASLHFFGGWDMSDKSQAFKQSCADSAERLGVADAVYFHGFTADPQQAFAACDVLLNLSESESFSMVCLEALRYRLPVVAADSGGPGEIVLPGKGGFIVANRDWRKAAEALAKLLEDITLRKQLAEAGYQHVKQNFDEIIQAHLLLKIYASR